MSNIFQDFFKSHERYFDMLAMHMDGVKQHPEYENLVRSSYIAHKTKAEFSAMALYYKTIAIPEAEKLVKEFQSGYNASSLKRDYPELDQAGVFEDSFLSVMREVVMSGYISISHKIENLIEFIKNHSAGTSFGSMIEPKHRIVNYIHVLKEDFNLPFDRLMENEYRNDINHVNKVITPRIHRIRVTANRIKHQGGYPKSNNDIIIPYFKEFQSSASNQYRYMIPFRVEEFLIDLEYAEKYIDTILELINNTHIYAIIKEIISKPIITGQEEYRYSLENEQLPRYRSYIKHLVKNILDVKLDVHLLVADRLPHPKTFLQSTSTP